MPGVIFVNPSSGPDGTSVEDLQRRFPGQRVEECAPEEIVKRVRTAVEEGVDFVGVAGGDGTIRAAAEELVGKEAPLLPIPAGTRNHFARDLGIDSLDRAAAALADGTTRRISVGQVNRRSFLNNSSVGLYPKIVVRREAHERALPKGPATVVAVYEQLRHGHRFVVDIDGRRRRVWMVFVGNGRYGEGLLDLADRESLDDAVLDVRIVRADRPLARVRVVLALLLGRLARSPLVERHTVEAVQLDIQRASVEVALDGEVEQLTPPLEYRLLPDALEVFCSA